MKKIFLMLAIIAIAFSQNSFGQNSTTTQLLDAYYKLKDALVSSKETIAADNADKFIQAVNAADKQTINEDLRQALIKDATAISQSKNLKQQREKFSALSDNMLVLAKKVKLSAEPVYQQYCPMKKASWLSNDKTIKNPYYGSAMLTCGTVKATL